VRFEKAEADIVLIPFGAVFQSAPAQEGPIGFPDDPPAAKAIAPVVVVLFQEAPGGLYAFKRAIARVLDDLRFKEKK
jgi:hypothetical protein